MSAREAAGRTRSEIRGQGSEKERVRGGVDGFRDGVRGLTRFWGGAKGHEKPRERPQVPSFDELWKTWRNLWKTWRNAVAAPVYRALLFGK